MVGNRLLPSNHRFLRIATATVAAAAALRASPSSAGATVLAFAPPAFVAVPGSRPTTRMLSTSDAAAAGVGGGVGESSISKTYIDKLALILVDDRRRQLVARSKGKSAFFTPGGKREGDESDVDALVRECREELTVELIRDSVKRYGVFEAQAFGKAPGTMVRMTCFTADFEGEVRADEEVEELRWVDSSCPRELLTETGIMILEDLKARDLID